MDKLNNFFLLWIIYENKNLVTGKADCVGVFWLEKEPAQQLLCIDISSCVDSKTS